MNRDRHTTVMSTTTTMSSSSVPSASTFPSQGILPKSDTQVDSYLSAHPEADGRQVVVAVFDTGCDPGASGLARTTTGEIKFIDFIDASGSGDVQTSTTIDSTVPVNGLIQFVSPASGRTIVIPANKSGVVNPRLKWYVGVKRAYEMFPAPLVERMKKERKKIFDESQRRLEQELSRRLANWDEDAAAATASSTTSGESSYPTTFTAKDKTDLETRLAEVKSATSKFDDPGPIFDVVAWHTGNPSDKPTDDREPGWFAMVDSTCTGDFTLAKPLTNWRDSHEYGTFSGVDLMNYTVNIFQGGKVVSVVTTAGSHGTHVAGIIGANEGSMEHNGIAPGCRMVSIKIGDSRLGSMETGVALIRGLIEAIRLKVDVINMSYGEESSLCNSGRISELIRSAIFDHGIIFVSSAGNNGPALTTVGSPGGTDTGVISVGAYVSPDMSLACYSSRKPVIGNQYSWSSRGPTIDGDRGVTVSACGGAVTSVCNWQLQKSQLMNGTSMSSPACAGGVALLCSGLKLAGIPYTPQRIKKAIENTARSVAHLDSLTIGSGLLQVQAAYDYLVANASRPELDLLYKVTIPALNARGLYLRDAIDSAKPYEASVSIEAVFKEQRIDEPTQIDEEKKDSTIPVGLANPLNFALNKSKISFEQKIALVSSVNWIDAPSHLILHHGGRAFTMVVHGEKLSPGAHYTELLGFDTAFPKDEWSARGPLFSVPITVIKVEDPIIAQNALAAAEIQLGASGDSMLAPGSVYKFSNLPCDSGTVHRKFVTVPEGATYVDFTITAHSFRPIEGENNTAADPSRSYMFHALYLQAENAPRDHQVESFFSLTTESPKKELRMDVRSGQTLEVCITQYWSSLGPSVVDVEVAFEGVVADNQEEIVLDSSDGFHPIHFRSTIRATKVTPTASLKTWNSVVKPSAAVIAPCTKERDLIVLGSRLISSLVLTYYFELSTDSSNVRVRAPILNQRLYESVYESQLTQIFDSNKRFMFATDAFETGKALKAGKYIAKIQVRHDDVSLLERLKDMSVVVERALADPINLSVYGTYPTAVTGGAKYSSKVIKAGKSGLCYVNIPDSKSLPSFAKPGDWGTGSLVLVKNESGEKGGSINLRLYAHAAPAPAEKPTPPASAPKKDPSKPDKPAEGEQDPSFPKLEQKDADVNVPTTTTTAADGAASPTSTDQPTSPVASSPSASSSAPSPLAVELRDLTITHLSKLKASGDTAAKVEALNDILPPLLAQFPSHLPLLFLELRFHHELSQTDAKYKPATVAKLDSFLNRQIDQNALLAHFGRLIEKDDTAGQALRKEKEEVRKFVIKALSIKLEIAMNQLKGFKSFLRQVEYQPSLFKELDGADEPNEQTYSQVLSSFQKVWSELSQWLDLTSKDGKAQFASYQLFQLKLARQYGLLLKTLNADILAAEGAPQQKLIQDKIDLLQFLSTKSASSSESYQHLIQYEKDQLIIKSVGRKSGVR